MNHMQVNLFVLVAMPSLIFAQLSPAVPVGVHQLVTENPGYMIIDCGSDKDYYDKSKGLFFRSDRDFTINEGGESHVVSPECSFNEGHVGRSVNSLRSFPQGRRNCYTIEINRTQNYYYFVRAYFRYGNYDGKNNSPIFNIYVGVNYWMTLPHRSPIQGVHFISTEALDVCLVNIGRGTPYISTLELLPLLNTSLYKFHSQSLTIDKRFDVGTSINPSNVTVWPKDDVYGRYWYSHMQPEWVPISTSDINFSDMEDLKEVPVEVLRTAAQPPKNGSNSLSYTYTNTYDTPYEYYFYFHFAEISKLERGKIRQVVVSLNNVNYGPVALDYMKPRTIRSNKISIPNNGSVTFYIRSTDPDLPPILNAFQICVIFPRLTFSPTEAVDVAAISEIKRKYRVNRDEWQGDPCMPTDFSWDGLRCADDGDRPRIISLNLSSSNLAGEIDSSFFQLRAIQLLDLSYNKLNGTVPEFLGQLPNLTVLNLTGNNFTGSLPQSLIAKSKSGVLQFSLNESPSKCQKQSCEEKKHSFVLPVTASVVSILVLLLLTFIAIFWRIRRKKERAGKSKPGNRPSLKSKNEHFTYSEIVSATNNFSNIIGKGGFGKVYLGCLKDGNQVAIKLLSQSSSQGCKEFISEVQLLTIIHHRNLVSLVGYCNEPNNLALVYEYMENGNLRQHLSEHSRIEVLSWKRRVQIAVDAAHGLEYLHNGCKPSIIHRDLKTSNILLDKNLSAKISDFGLSRVFATERDSHLNTRPAGTFGYVDPEFYASGKLNKKSDVYSFGVIVLELITGLPAVIKGHESSTHILKWIGPIIQSGDITGIIDPNLKGEFNTNSAWKVVEIALCCAEPTAIQRPDMNQVLAELKECLAMEMESERPGGKQIGITVSNNSLDMSLPSPR